MVETPQYNSPLIVKGKKQKGLTNSGQDVLFMTLKPLCKYGSFEYRVLTRVGKNFGVHHTTIRKLWNANVAFAGQALSTPAKKFSHQEQCGRAHVYDCSEELIECVKKIPISQHRTYCDLAAELGFPLVTIYCIIMDGAF